MWPPAHPLCRAKAGIGGMAWWEGGGGSWEGKEVRWWATDRLVRGPTVNLAASRSLRPCTCWILADRGGGGVAVEGKCGVRNPQTASWSTPNMVVSPANRPGGRGDRRGYSRPARRDVPTAGVWCVPGVPCHHPGRYQEVCCWVGRFSWGGYRVDLTPILGTKSGSLCRGPSGSPRAFRVSECLGLDRGERWGVGTSSSTRRRSFHRNRNM